MKTGCRRKFTWKTVVGLTFLVLAGCFSGNLDAGTPVAERRSATVIAVERSSPAVVNIRTEEIVQRPSGSFFWFGGPAFEEFFRDLLPPQGTYTTQSLGSGVIIDSKRHVLTNAHVIAHASRIYVALPDRPEELEAELVGMDAASDLAVLRIKTDTKLPHLAPARSDDLMVGETVIAIGNPLGLGHSITTGIVSAARRRIPVGESRVGIFIQTDALINPGNSGGPLINIKGELIGINTAIARQAQGIGFAIPIDTAKRLLPDLIRFGKVRKVYWGAEVEPVHARFRRSPGGGGVLVSHLDPGGPAAKAGVQVADVIQRVAGIPVGSIEEFHAVLTTFVPEARLALEVLRRTRQVELSLQLSVFPEGYGLTWAKQRLGLTVREAGGQLWIASVAPGSPAAQAGLRRGDRLARVAEHPVTSEIEFSDWIEEYHDRGTVPLLVVRNGRGYRLQLP